MGIDLFGPSVNAGGVTSRPADTRLLNLIDTWFKDCSGPGLQDGTEDQAAWRNAILALLRALARGNGQTGGGIDVVTESNVNDSLLLTAVKYLIQRQVENYADDTGAANAITVSFTPALSEYKKGFRFWTQILNKNTSTAVTINANGLGAKSVKTVNGANPNVGACPAAAMMCFEYDGTNFQIVSTLGAEAFSLPKATITLSAIASLAWGTASSHGMAVASSNDMGAGPTISGGNAVVLPAGTYLFTIKSTVTANNVNNTTQVAGHTLILKNGVEQQRAVETTHLLSGQNITVFPGFSGSISVNGTDTIAVQELIGTTIAGDFSSGSSAAGVVSFYRVGA